MLRITASARRPRGRHAAPSQRSVRKAHLAWTHAPSSGLVFHGERARLRANGAKKSWAEGKRGRLWHTEINLGFSEPPDEPGPPRCPESHSSEPATQTQHSRAGTQFWMWSLSHLAQTTPSAPQGPSIPAPSQSRRMEHGTPPVPGARGPRYRAGRGVRRRRASLPLPDRARATDPKHLASTLCFLKLQVPFKNGLHLVFN